MTNKKSTRTEINKLLGLRSTREEKPHVSQQIPATHFPIRLYALGKSKGSKQGIAGWRQQYHRPFDVELAPQTTTRIEYPDDSPQE